MVTGTFLLLLAIFSGQRNNISQEAQFSQVTFQFIQANKYVMFFHVNPTFAEFPFLNILSERMGGGGGRNSVTPLSFLKVATCTASVLVANMVIT